MAGFLGAFAHLREALFGKSYWQGLIDWLRETVLASGAIDQHDLGLIRVTDSPAEACRWLLESYQHETWKAKKRRQSGM